MAFTIKALVEGITEEVVKAIEESITYFGFYSGVVEVQGKSFDFWRDRDIEDDVVLVVDDYRPW